MITCHNCGEAYSTLIKYCTHCGAKIRVEPFNIEQHLLGKIIADRYRVIGLIGKGGMSQVYKIEHIRIGKIMAMKVLHPKHSSSIDMIKRFKREAEAISKLSSVNTVNVFDFGKTDDFFYIIMEYINGPDLESVIDNDGPISLKRGVPILVQICQSLLEAHELGIVHRDLKPDNIIIAQTREGKDFVKVLDFGLAKVETLDQGGSITQHNQILGTPYYMSPEVIQNEMVDQRVDIYALGGIMFKMFSGTEPYSGNSTIEILSKHLNDRLPHIQDKNPLVRLPEGIMAIITKAMAKNPADRYQNLNDFLFDLQTIYNAYIDELNRKQAVSPDLISSGEKMALAEPSLDSILDESFSLAPDILTREDWQSFQKRAKTRRLILSLLGLLLLCGLALALYWGVSLGNFYKKKVETEPNNSAAEANRIFADYPVIGYIGKKMSVNEGDRDFFVFHHPGQTEHLLQIELSGISGLDIKFEVWADNRRILNVNSNGLSEGESFANLFINRPLYYIVVREVWVEGEGIIPAEDFKNPYRLKISPRKFDPAEEIEPNDTFESATFISPGKEMKGFLDRPEDLDTYKLSGLMDGRLSLRLTPPRGVDIALRLYDSSESKARLEINEGDISQAEKIKDFPIIRNNFPYYIQVYSKKGISQTEPYRIGLEITKL